MIVVTVIRVPRVGLVSAVGIAGALVAFAIVYGLSWRGGMNTDRLVLVGIGLWFGFTGADHVVPRPREPLGYARPVHLAVRFHVRPGVGRCRARRQ